MGDHHHRHALPGQLLHDLQHLAHHFGVQGGSGLVKEHQLRLHGQGTDNGDPLLLPTGKLGRVGIRPVRQPHALQQLDRLRIGFSLLHKAGAHRRQGNVSADGHIGKEIEVLEHHPHLAAHLVDLRLRVGDLGAAEGDRTGRGRLQQVEAAQERGFARAGRPDDHHLFPGGDVLADIVQHQVAAEGFGQVFNVDHFDAASFPACPEARSGPSRPPDTSRQCPRRGTCTHRSWRPPPRQSRPAPYRRWPRPGRCP